MARKNNNNYKSTNRSHKRKNNSIYRSNTNSSSVNERAKRKRYLKKKKYTRRRILVGLLTITILLTIISFISNAINSYKIMGYPEFRDEVLNKMSDEVFVSSSDGRSLSSAEKVTDFDDLYKTIERNFAVDKDNKENFEKFIKEYNSYRKKVYSSKTDQEYIKILNQYIAILDDSRTFILDKETYDHMFNYYRKNSNSYKNKILGNPQAVDRYKRLIADPKKIKPSMSVSIEKNKILKISLADFKADEFDKDLQKIVDLLLDNPPVGTVLLDLSNNSSIDNVYPNKLAQILIHHNYEESNLIFYRGKLIQDSLESIKANKNTSYSTPFVKNDVSKYPNEIKNINLNDYIYYDEISHKIEKNKDFSDRKIYVLTNEYTSNEAIKLANTLKDSEAYIVKNGLEANNTYKDIIYNMRSDLYVLEHSGLVLSLNSAYSKNESEENKYLKYDQKINSKDPIESMYDIIIN
jgi:hypothetical protein